MEAALQDDKQVVLNRADQPVLLVDASRPSASQLVLERLGLADPGERLAERVADQLVDPP